MAERVVCIGCIDFRMNRRRDGRDYTGEFTARLGYDCFPVSRAGGVQDLVRPLSNGFKESILRDIRVGVKGHGASRVISLNHENCAAYAHFQFRNRAEEISKHEIDLKEAKEIITYEFSGIIADLYFAELIPGTKDEFIIKPL